MDIEAGTGRDFSLGQVLTRTFGALAARPVPILIVALLFSAVPRLLWGIALQRLAAAATIVDFGQVFLVTQAGSLAIRLLGGVVVHGAVTWIVVEHAAHERVTFGRVLTVAGHTLLPLIGLSVVFALVVMVGLVAAIVPGVIVWVAWIVAAPALVAERKGVLAALARSANLTEGVRWQVFGLELAVLVFAMIIGGVVGVGGVILGMRGEEESLATIVLVVSSLASTLPAALSATVQAALYVELRDWKDGPPGDRLADIFA